MQPNMPPAGFGPALSDFPHHDLDVFALNILGFFVAKPLHASSDGAEDARVLLLSALYSHLQPLLPVSRHLRSY